MTLPAAMFRADKATVNSDWGQSVIIAHLDGKSQSRTACQGSQQFTHDPTMAGEYIHYDITFSFQASDLTHDIGPGDKISFGGITYRVIGINNSTTGTVVSAHCQEVLH